MKKIAIVYHEFCLGGTTTSLIFLLNSLNYAKVSVDLILYKKGGLLYDKINKNANVIIAGEKLSKFAILLRSLCSTKVFALFCRTVFRKDFLKKLRMGLSQIGAQIRAKKSLAISGHYDLAIGFMEFWASEYVLRLSSKKRIGIIHPNYEAACFDFVLDQKKFMALDHIAFVAPSNCESFKETSHHQYDGKVLYFPNIVDEQTIIEMSKEPVDINVPKEKKCVLVTSARLDAYVKGFDRLLDVASAFQTRRFPFFWLILGEGKDGRWLKQEIHKRNLNDAVIMLGQQVNPHKYVRIAQYFVLLSRREGKPMSVDEALLLGKRCVLASYETAYEQVKDDTYGFIVDNDNFDAAKVAERIIQDFDNGTETKPHAAPSFAENKAVVERIIYETE